VAESVEGDLVSTTVCLSAKTIFYPRSGGHLWVYLNWALGLHALGCRVIWMETLFPDLPAHEVRPYVDTLKSRLERYGLAECVALCSFTDEPLPQGTVGECLDIEAAAEADLLLDLEYLIAPKLVGRFRRSALVDIDPGLMQVWLSKGWINLARHDVYFTTGETVGKPGSRVPDAGLQWQYTPPCVALEWWPPYRAGEDASFTTVSHWFEDEWVEDAGEFYQNDKRTGFMPFLGLPQHTSQPLELALCLSPREEHEKEALQKRGWRVRHSYDIASTPWEYQRYIQDSLGEFSCVKPSCIRLQNAWVSDRTICYLASGKPAVIEHTGPSRFLPDAAGLFRFQDMGEAVGCLETVAADYEGQCRLARALAEEYFDAQKVAGSVLERALA
jgi:hypothetical protein